MWCFKNTNEIFAPSLNALIRSVILQVIFEEIKKVKGIFKLDYTFFMILLYF